MTCRPKERDPRPGPSGPVREKALVQGVVQGVGFRPFVFRLAGQWGLSGLVRNESRGVLVEVEGGAGAIEGFFADLANRKPPLAQIREVCRQSIPATGRRGFTIQASRSGSESRTLVSPDVGICPDCLRELFDPADRRYEHPFINCTACGPRYTIVKGLPYDRAMTTMADFHMCPACEKEYLDPKDRRFHAQPVACRQCGPRLRLCGPDGGEIPGDPVRLAGLMLSRGGIVAIKGLGGFHLAVDARSEDAIRRIRRRKMREQKPFAVMVADIETAQGLVGLDGEGLALLDTPHKPIVLAPMRPDADLASGVAPGLNRLGIMLAYTPLHHLLLKYGPKALVMTSGNMSGGPVCKGNQEALDRLGRVADAFLLHDRDIHARADDSVAMCAGGMPRVVRRARGYAPLPVCLKPDGPTVLALGAELKNTVCLARGTEAFLSPHVGDLRNPDALDFQLEAAGHLLGLLNAQPQALATDLHPDYLSTRQAERYPGLPIVRVQHHVAHALSAMAELGLETPFAALCLDGSGLGPDGSIWGCEFLKIGPRGFRRLGCLKPAPLPGGDTAARQPWRSSVGRLYAGWGEDWPEIAPPVLLEYIRSRSPGHKTGLFTRMMDQGLNSPMCSSLGRLFDAAAAMMGLVFENAYEGQAAMRLESTAAEGVTDSYPMLVTGPSAPGAEKWIGLDPAPLLAGVLDDLRGQTPPAQMAARFHNGLIHGLGRAAELACEMSGCRTVVLTGGCMMNRILYCGLSRYLTNLNLLVETHRDIPCNDGGLSLGQAQAARLALATGDLNLWSGETGRPRKET